MGNMVNNSTVVNWLRNTLLALGSFLATIWIWICYFFPKTLDDAGGIYSLYLLIEVDLLLLVLGVCLAPLSWTRLVKPRVVVAMLLAPFSHAIGAGIEAPWCDPFFLIPSAAILILSAWEVASRKGIAK